MKRSISTVYIHCNGRELWKGLYLLYTSTVMVGSYKGLYLAMLNFCRSAVLPLWCLAEIDQLGPLRYSDSEYCSGFVSYCGMLCLLQQLISINIFIQPLCPTKRRQRATGGKTLFIFPPGQLQLTSWTQFLQCTLF